MANPIQTVRNIRASGGFLPWLTDILVERTHRKYIRHVKTTCANCGYMSSNVSTLKAVIPNKKEK